MRCIIYAYRGWLLIRMRCTPANIYADSESFPVQLFNVQQVCFDPFLKLNFITLLF